MTKQEKTFFLFSAIAIFLASVFSTGFYHFDEHFQILEFAGLKLDLTIPKELPWEFHYQIRSGIQPGIIFIIGKALAFFGNTSPFSITFVSRLLSGTFTFFVLTKSYTTLQDRIPEKNYKKLFLIYASLSWFLIYMGVRFSPENWSGLTFLLALLYLDRNQISNTKSYFLSGILLGLSFLFRYQIGVMIALVFAWLLFVNKNNTKELLTIGFGITISILIGVLIDCWYYEEWTFPVLNYMNEFGNPEHAKRFATDPWWYYFTKFINQAVPPLSILILTGSLFYFIKRKSSLFTWVFVPFIVLHIFIGHKELRFLFPLVYMLPFVFVKGLELLSRETKLKQMNNSTPFQWFLKLCLIVNVALIVLVTFRPASQDIDLFKSIYTNYPNQTVLYHIDKNPYYRVWLNVNYYKRSTLQITNIESVDSIPKQNNKPQLIVFTNKTVPDNFEKTHKLIYSSFPKWMSMFNFNNWQSRTKSWLVFEL